MSKVVILMMSGFLCKCGKRTLTLYGGRCLECRTRLDKRNAKRKGK